MTFKHFIFLSLVVCMGLAGCRNPSAPAPASADTDQQQRELAVMSFNLRYATRADGENAWHLRKNDVMALVKHHQVDLLGVQEALPAQMQDLQQGLPGYASLGVGRDPDNQGEFSAIFYAEDKFQLLDAETFWLSPSPDVPSKGWDAALNRICTWGRFRVRDTGHEFLLLNTHFDHIGEQARHQSAQLILKKITELNPDQLPVILSGDFNLTEKERPIMLVSEALDDSFYHAEHGHQGPGGTFQDFSTQVRELERIDYIFTQGMDVLTHAHLDDRRASAPAHYPSDHFPVLVTLRFQEGDK